MDLSLEGPAWKISRRQATIRVKNNGEFLIASEGKRPIYVDGTPISTGNKRVINNNSVLEVSLADFCFNDCIFCYYTRLTLHVFFVLDCRIAFYFSH